MYKYVYVCMYVHMYIQMNVYIFVCVFTDFHRASYSFSLVYSFGLE